LGECVVARGCAGRLILRSRFSILRLDSRACDHGTGGIGHLSGNSPPVTLRKQGYLSMVLEMRLELIGAAAAIVQRRWLEALEMLHIAVVFVADIFHDVATGLQGEMPC
jgi:hypothetical protein